MLKKIKSKDGSAMTIAIIVILLIGIFSSLIMSMLTNQIKFNMKNSKNTNLKYEAEAGVEETVANFIEDVNFVGNVTVNVPMESQSEFDIVRMYIELANAIIGGNGIDDSIITPILNEIKEGDISKSKMINLSEQLDIVINEIDRNNSSKHGYAHKDVIDLLNIAKSYTDFFIVNFYEVDGEDLKLNMDYSLCINLINKALYNLREMNFENDTDVYGNIGRAYRDLNFGVNGNGNKRLTKSYNLFQNKNNIKIPYENLTIEEAESKKNEIDIWVGNNVSKMISKITAINYGDEILNNKNEIDKKSSYLKESNIKENYRKSSSYCGWFSGCNIQHKTLVKNRLDIVKKEIDIIVNWLTNMQTIKNMTNGSSRKPIMAIPKAIPNGNKNAQVLYNTINSNNVNLLQDDNSGNYRFEILSLGSETRIKFNLKVQSEVVNGENDNYKIEANIIVKIHDVISEDNYKIDYEIESWNKI